MDNFLLAMSRNASRNAIANRNQSIVERENVRKARTYSIATYQGYDSTIGKHKATLLDGSEVIADKYGDRPVRAGQQVAFIRIKKSRIGVITDA